LRLFRRRSAMRPGNLIAVTGAGVEEEDLIVVREGG